VAESSPQAPGHLHPRPALAGGTSRPSLDLLRKLALALSVRADGMLFDDAERGLADTLKKLQFEAASARFDADEKHLL
jgi:hypothetical protein